MGSRLNCIDAIQIGTHNIRFYKETDNNYTGCNQKTKHLLSCALILVCAVIIINTVFIKRHLSG